MFRLCRLVTILMSLALSVAANAAERSAYVVYDVVLREFICWTEDKGTKAVPAPPVNGRCAGVWHAVTGDLYFLRGQSISVVLANAKSIDLFGVDLTAADLPEPPVSVLGDFSSLPKIVPIPPAPSLSPGPGTTFAAGPSTFDPDSRFYRLLGTAEEKDFKSWLKDNLVDPLAAKEIQDLLATNTLQSIASLNFQGPALMMEAQSIGNALNSSLPKTTTVEIVLATRWLANLIERQRALKDRTVVSGLSGYAKPLTDLEKGLRSAAGQRALGIDLVKLDGVLAELETAFPPGSGYSRIEKVEVDPVSKTYIAKNDPEKTDMQEFLRRLNADDGVDADASGLPKVKKNIAATLDSLSDLKLARKRLNTTT